MTQWNWNGAKWWKIDFHTHTPASDDYGKRRHQDQLKERSPREWLLDYMRAEIDCVAVTDHNSGAWVDTLKTELATLELDPPPGFRPLRLFPGVEISVQGGVHLLAIFDVVVTAADIDSLLGAVGFSGTKGASDDVTSKSLAEVAAEIERAGGIAIPAHVDRPNGLFDRLKGSTLRQALSCDHVLALEVVDTDSVPPAVYSETQRGLTEILGSDSHHPSGNAGQRYPGSHFTWIKMGSPNLEGLRLALLDGESSVRRSDQETDDPNRTPASVMEAIEVSNARYMGRAQPFTLRWNPWLNAIVGGRGTGKSTVVELLRLVLRRTAELPDELAADLDLYSEVSAHREDRGLLTSEAEIRVIYRQDGSRYRVQWSPAGDLDPIEEDVSGKGWRRAEGEVARRFPIRLYSQKQVFHMAREPLALLKIVDDAPEVDCRGRHERWQRGETRFLSTRAKLREIEASLREEPRLRGELADVKRKLAVFEQAGHADILREFQIRSRQLRAVESWEKSLGTLDVSDLEAELLPEDFDPTALGIDSAEATELQRLISKTQDDLVQILEKLRELSKKADAARDAWLEGRDSSRWKLAVDDAIQAHEDLCLRLAEENVGNPTAYSDLVQQRQSLEGRLGELSAQRAQQDRLRQQAAASLGGLLEIRRELTEARRKFLDQALNDNPHVRIRIVPYGSRETVELELRALLQQEDGRFEKDVGSPEGGGLLGELYQDGAEPESVENALSEIKRRIRAIATGASSAQPELADKRFATSLAKLQPEALDRLDLWFPEDSLDVQYSPTGDGKHFRSIQEGSPGQKTAALLAFLLSYGDEPLILDQPEDDLDNHLIYDLIVKQLREVKRRRQVIVVTHNANIVVNGDAELIMAFAARGGETKLEREGSLQKQAVRETICDVMEGGRSAFEQRYRRIALEGLRRVG